MCMAVPLLGAACPFPFGSTSGQAAKKASTTSAYLMPMGNVSSSTITTGDKFLQAQFSAIKQVYPVPGIGQVW